MAFTEKYGTSGTKNINIAHRNSGSNQPGGSTKHSQIGRAEIKRLRKALELEKLRSKAFSTMIDLAEETFNIPVRKNLVPNSKLAPHRVPEPRFRHSMWAVWFHPASI